MLNFNRNERPSDPRSGERSAPRPGTPAAPATPSTASIGRPLVPGIPPAAGATPAPSATGAPPSPAGAPAAGPVHEPPALTATSGGSKLIVGRNVKLKGVEISDCDLVVVEGQVEASVASKGMQIAKPGTLKGNAVIDVAEIDGEFSGELTAHLKLVVNGSGRVSGTIRYGSLIVAEGGEVTGDVKRLDEPNVPVLRAPVDPRTVSGANPMAR